MSDTPALDQLVRRGCRRLVDAWGEDLTPAERDRAVELAFGIMTRRGGVQLGAAAHAALAIVRSSGHPSQPTSTVEVLAPIPLPPASPDQGTGAGTTDG